MLTTTLLACALGLGLLVYRYDMYEREPWYMLILAAALGMGACWTLSYGEDVVLGRLPDGRTSIFAQAAVASVLEELVKLLIVLAIWGTVSQHFNDPFDGLIYGAMAGLGFALAESLFYVDLIGTQLSLPSAVGQEAVRLVLHLLLGALTCAWLGLARFRISGWPYMLCFSVAASMLIHFCWDYFCGLPSTEEMGVLQQRSIAVALMLTSFVLFGLAVVTAKRHSGDTHAISRMKHLWGWPFSNFRGRR